MPSHEAAVLRWFVCWLLHSSGNCCKSMFLPCSEALFISKLNITVVEEGVLGEKYVQVVFVLVCFWLYNSRMLPQELSVKGNQRVSSATAYRSKAIHRIIWSCFSKWTSKLGNPVESMRLSKSYMNIMYMLSVSSFKLFPFALNRKKGVSEALTSLMSRFTKRESSFISRD